eukprot:PhF_6_TR41592/c0_g1_i2/m.63029
MSSTTTTPTAPGLPPKRYTGGRATKIHTDAPPSTLPSTQSTTLTSTYEYTPAPPVAAPIPTNSQEHSVGERDEIENGASSSAGSGLMAAAALVGQRKNSNPVVGISSEQRLVDIQRRLSQIDTMMTELERPQTPSWCEQRQTVNTSSVTSEALMSHGNSIRAGVYELEFCETKCRDEILTEEQTAIRDIIVAHLMKGK